MRYNRLVDIIIALGICLSIFVGVSTLKHSRQTASKQIEATSQVDFIVHLKGVKLASGMIPFKVNDTTFITIRNVPYSDLKIIDTTYSPKMITVYANNSKGYSLIPDESQPNTFDVNVKLTDVAKITKDGAVVGGNKIKIGIPITLEGKTYKLTGSICDVDILADRD